MQTVQIANQLFSLLTIAGQIAIAVGIMLLFTPYRATLIAFCKKRATLIAFAVALTAMLGSLFYSEIIGYEPCKLCWFQRIAMYPQVLILGIALWKRDRNALNYSIGLSAIGAIIAGYHYLLQIGAAPNISCSAVGYSVACSQRFVMNYGYITLPMMALTAFAFILAISLIAKLRASRVEIA